jgi:hypothetical protein
MSECPVTAIYETFFSTLSDFNMEVTLKQIEKTNRIDNVSMTFILLTAFALFASLTLFVFLRKLTLIYHFTFMPWVVCYYFLIIGRD